MTRTPSARRLPPRGPPSPSAPLLEPRRSPRSVPASTAGTSPAIARIGACREDPTNPSWSPSWLTTTPTPLRSAASARCSAPPARGPRPGSCTTSASWPRAGGPERVTASSPSPTWAGWPSSTRRTPWWCRTRSDVDSPQHPEVLAAIRRAHERGARLIGLCTGAFALAEAGCSTTTGHRALAAGGGVPGPLPPRPAAARRPLRRRRRRPHLRRQRGRARPRPARRAARPRRGGRGRRQPSAGVRRLTATAGSGSSSSVPSRPRQRRR